MVNPNVLSLWSHIDTTKKSPESPFSVPGVANSTLANREIIPSNWLSLREKWKWKHHWNFRVFDWEKYVLLKLKAWKSLSCCPQKNWRWIKVSTLNFWVSSVKSVFFPWLKHFYPILMGISVTIIPRGSRSSSYIPTFWGSKTNVKNQQNAKCHWEKLVCN